MKRSSWPLLVIAAPAAVAIWSGWVGLGQLAGFGTIRPLPGILPWHLDTAITLPVGIEAYGAYALGAWLAPVEVPAEARTFARRSAIGALLLGMAGQVVFHLLAAAHATRAPWPVVMLVSCVPVVTLGFAAALTHLLRSEPAEAPKPATATVPEALQLHPNGSAPALNGKTHPATAQKRPARSGNGNAPDPLIVFAAELDAGKFPSKRDIQKRMHVGWDKVDAILADLEREIARRLIRTP